MRKTRKDARYCWHCEQYLEDVIKHESYLEGPVTEAEALRNPIVR